MELPFYLRILPPEALEVLAYYRRLGHNIAYAGAMMTATGLSERGFGKAIRRLVTKGYLVLDGDQRYRLTEHGQRAVDDLPESMAARAGEAEAPEPQHTPVDDSSTDIDPLFDEPTLESGVDAGAFLAGEAFDENADAIDRLFGHDESEEDDLFAELNDEDAAAFNEFFGGADEDEAPEAPSPTVEDLFAGLEDDAGSLAEALPAVAPQADEIDSAPEPSFPAASAGLDSDSLFEWLELGEDSVSNEEQDFWGDVTPQPEAAEQPQADAESHIVERRLVVALPQPLVAGQAAHVTVGILPGEGAAVAEPLPLTVRLAVLNGQPAQAQDFPMLLTNGLTRQDVTIRPGHYRQVRLRVHVYQRSDEADEAILCGGMYVDADVVEAAEGQPTPVAFGADTHFVLDV